MDTHIDLSTCQQIHKLACIYAASALQLCTPGDHCRLLSLLLVCSLFLVPCRIYLELLHDYELAEEYCDSIYAESQTPSRDAVQQLPASLQARLQGVGVEGWPAPAASGGDMYLLLIQVRTTPSAAAAAAAAVLAS